MCVYCCLDVCLLLSGCVSTAVWMCVYCCLDVCLLLSGCVQQWAQHKSTAGSGAIVLLFQVLL